jgi:glutamine synthetase
MNDGFFSEDGPALPAGDLERIIGKPPAEWTPDDLIELVKEYRIRLVSLMHMGGDGNLKTLDFVPRSLSHLDDLIHGGERADGSSLFPGTGLKSDASDIVLRPRVERAFLDPFSPHPTLAILCGHRGRDGEPLPQSPDTVVRSAHERLKKECGVDLWALGEVEYFLGRRAEKTDIWGRAERGYHATAPFVFGESLRRNALQILAAIGIPLKYGHSEVGYIEAGEDVEEIWEQHEIELGLTPLPEAADAIALTQWVLRNLALRANMLLSFEPIVRVGHAGSGMHVHFSPVVKGEHLGGRNAEGHLEDPARWLIVGLTQLGGALMAFGNRVEGSFTRLTQGKEAPNVVTWGEFDRNALIRLPIVARTAEGKAVSPPTVEFRLPDGSVHPHFLLAGVAQATAHASTRDDVAEILTETEARRARVQPGGAVPVPQSKVEVMAAARAARGVLEEGGVFPPGLVEAALRAW